MKENRPLRARRAPFPLQSVMSVSAVLLCGRVTAHHHRLGHTHNDANDLISRSKSCYFTHTHSLSWHHYYYGHWGGKEERPKVLLLFSCVMLLYRATAALFVGCTCTFLSFFLPPSTSSSTCGPCELDNFFSWKWKCVVVSCTQRR